MSKISKKVSMQDIADRLDISKNAVSLALRGKTGVSEETRTLILQMAKRMNYAGLGESTKKDDKILVIIPEYIRHDTYFYNDVYWSIEAKAKQKGYIALLTSVSEEMQKTNELPPIINDMDFLGIITVGILPLSYMEILCKLTSNIVSVDHFYNELAINTVMSENIQGGYLITKYIIEQGHKDIGFAGPIGMTSSIYERWCGYCQAMLEANLPVNKSNCILINSPLNSLLSDVTELTENIVAITDKPTAWVCGGDRIAISLIESLSNLGYKVPKDISVAGFDNIELGEMITPPLTTVNVKRELLGEKAVDTLIQSVGEGVTAGKTTIYTKLVIRSSVSKITTK